MAGARQLLRRGETGRAGADDSHRLPVFAPHSGCDPAFLPSLVDDVAFDGLDGTGVSSMLRVQAASHGAGQTRPVNSGKLLVECKGLDRLAPLAL